MKTVFRRWRLPLVALITTFSIFFLSNSSAFANEPGESNTWAYEVVGGQIASTAGDVVEARDPNTGNLLQVWRGNGNNNIWASLNHGRIWQLYGATTYATPAVVFTNSGFQVFHTGTNGFIFYATANVFTGNGSVSVDGWNQVPNNAETPNNLSVAVTALPNNDLYLAYRGASSNDIWGMYHAGGHWDLPLTAFGATSESSPSLAFSTLSQTILLAYRGLDNRVNVIRQAYGNGQWSNRQILNGFTVNAQPAIAMAGHGIGQVAGRETGSNRLVLATFTDIYGFVSWSYETNSFVARYGPTLISYGLTVYLLATANNGNVLWKQSGYYP